MELYYLIENRNGFEKLLASGSERELTAERERLQRETPTPSQERKPGWDTVGYYIVPGHEWHGRDCPLIPVDLS
ncbi:MAG: hypothetical protein ABSE25_07275 [Syntrophorhabdales bacterium]|jgi:hypothetical protein